MKIQEATAPLLRQLKMRNWLLAIVLVEVVIVELMWIVPLFR